MCLDLVTCGRAQREPASATAPELRGKAVENRLESEGGPLAVVSRWATLCAGAHDLCLDCQLGGGLHGLQTVVRPGPGLTAFVRPCTPGPGLNIVVLPCTPTPSRQLGSAWVADPRYERDRWLSDGYKRVLKGPWQQTRRFKHRTSQLDADRLHPASI